MLIRCILKETNHIKEIAFLNIFCLQQKLFKDELKKISLQALL